MSNKYNKVTHCIFDMDGLILDTESLYSNAVNDVLNLFGKEYTWENKVKTMGSPFHQCVDYLIEAFQLPIKHEELKNILINEYSNFYKTPRIKLLPGAEKLIRHLYDNNIPIALASSTSQDGFNKKTKYINELFELFNHKVLGGSDPDVKFGKPKPDIFLIAAKRFLDKPDVSKCLVFEDAPNGVEAGISAGMQVVMVPDSNLPDKFKTKATLVLNSLTEFKPEDFGLPKYKST